MRRARKGLRRPVCCFLVFSVLTACMGFSAGCWDKRELENQAFVQALGIDKSPGGVLVTAMIATPRNLAGGGGGGGGVTGEASFVTSVESSSIIGAMDLMNVYVDRKINLMHSKVFVVGKDLAREGVAKSLGALMRYREIRRDVFIVVSEGKASDFLNNYKPILESNAGKWFEIITQSYSYTGLIPRSQYHGFLLAMESLAVQPAAILAAVGKPEQKIEKRAKESSGESKNIGYAAGSTPREGGVPIEMLGAAVFRGDKMVGQLSGAETRILNLLRGEFRRAIITFEDPIVKGTYIPVEIKQGRPPSIRVSRGERPDVKIRLSLEGDILGIQSRENYGVDPKKTALFETWIKNKLGKEAEALISKSQTLGADIAGLGEYARKNQLTYQQWEEYHWPDRFKKASVSVDVSFHIRRIGLQLSQPVPRP